MRTRRAKTSPLGTGGGWSMMMVAREMGEGTGRSVVAPGLVAAGAVDVDCATLPLSSLQAKDAPEARRRADVTKIIRPLGALTLSLLRAELKLRRYFPLPRCKVVRHCSRHRAGLRPR